MHILSFVKYRTHRRQKERSARSCLFYAHGSHEKRRNFRIRATVEQDGIEMYKSRRFMYILYMARSEAQTGALKNGIKAKQDNKQKQAARSGPAE